MKKIIVLEVKRKETLWKKLLRLVRLSSKETHWVVTALTSEPVSVPNLLKIDNSFKLVVRNVNDRRTILETIRPMTNIPDVSTYEIRMDHWKF